MIYTLVTGTKGSFETKLEDEIDLIEGTGRRVVNVQFSSYYDSDFHREMFSALIAHEELD